jgi:hypothetical protein
MSPSPSPSMSFPTSITPIILDTILGHLAPHFLTSTNGDLPSARHAASHILAAYNVETEEELRLAAEIVSFGFHALEALGQAAAPDLPLNKTLRLRGSAVSLSREAHKSQRKLDQLQRARRTATAAPQAQASPAPDKPGTEQAIGLIEFAREALEASTKTGGAAAWTLSRQQRRAAERIAENFKRNKAEQARREASRIAIPAETLNQLGAA